MKNGKFAESILKNKCLGLILLILTTLSINAQNYLLGLTPDAHKTSSSQSSIENVSPYNGRLNISVPLLTIKGRGADGYQMMFSVNPQWTTFPVYGLPGETPRGMASAQLGSPIAHPGYGPGLMGRRAAYNDLDISPEGVKLYSKVLSYFTFVMPDGSEMDFYDDLHKGELLVPNGASRGTVFYSKNGDGSTYITDQIVYDETWSGDGGPPNQPYPSGGFLKMKNGLTYRITYGGAVQWIEDANGNRTTLTYANPGSYFMGPLLKITDSLNREVTISYGSGAPASDEITYKGVGGVSRTIRVNRGLLSNLLKSGNTFKTIGQLFPESGYYNFNETVNTGLISTIEFPDGRFYDFKYNSYSEVARITLPTGGALEYDYSAGYVGGTSSGTITNSASDAVYRRVTERRVLSDGVNVSLKTTFSRPETSDAYSQSYSNSGYVDVDQKDGNNNLINRVRHYYLGYGGGQTILQAWLLYNHFHQPWQNGLEYQTDIIDNNGATVLSRVINNWETRYNRSWGGEAPQITFSDKITSPTTSNLFSRTTFSYDQFGNQTDLYEYDFGVGQPGAFKRRIHTDFVTDSNYIDYMGAHLRGLLLQTWVSSDANGATKASLTQFEYDNYAGGDNATLIGRPNVVGHDTTNYDTNKTNRGNVTKITTYGNAQTQTEPISVYSQYDILGNVVKKIDAKGYISTIDYDDRFGAPNHEARSNTAPSQLNGQFTFAFPTSATNPNGDRGFTQVDYFTGQTVNAEDVNGVISKMIYNDKLNRPTLSVTAVGTDFEMQSSIIYDDANHRVETKSDLNDLNDNLIKSESFYDGLGRTIESRRYEADGGFIATKSIPFVMVQDPETSIWRVGAKSSNPYRPLAGEQSVWTTSLSDSLGRNIKVITTPDGAFVKTEYSNNTVTVTDQAGKKHRSVTNALGQLTRVDEPNEAGQMDVNSSPAQSTNYSYDTLDNLTTVSQGVQTRTFIYNSLSRLLSATNPELGTTPTNGTISYQYDNNGNLTQKTDARNVQTTYSYDNLNRVLTRKYLNEPSEQTATPNVTFTYDDTNIANSKGKLTKVLSSISETKYTAFDLLGKVLSSQQITDGQTYNSSYVYNLSGALIEETYPSGRVVKNILDNDGDLAQVQSRKANDTFRNYANSFNYSASGAVSSMRLGNGLWENTSFNSRLQPTQIGLGSGATSQNLLKLNYDYGSTANNGNVQSQTITVPTVGNNPGFTAIQTYTYDSLNRLKQADEKPSGYTQADCDANPTKCWKQTFTFDRYGNRNFDQLNTTETATFIKNCLDANNQKIVCENEVAKYDPSVNTANNRLNGYAFDNSGNTTKNAQSRKFTYDGENKQIKVETVDSGGTVMGTLGEYFYDGHGKRVKKVSTTETTIFVYDASGQMVAEYSTQLATTPQVSYLTTDHLGSPRINTDANGQVTARHDYQPFGEEISTTQRTQGLGYTTDNIRQKFTGYERDSESELEFAQARYLSSKIARFYSVDPENAGAIEDEPQSWNGYSYVLNNPINITDSTGLIWVRNTETGVPTWIPDSEYDSGSKIYTAIPEDQLTFMHNGNQVVLDKAGPSGDYAGWSYGGQRMGGSSNSLSNTVIATTTLGIASTAITLPLILGGGAATDVVITTGTVSVANPVTGAVVLTGTAIGGVALWWWMYFPDTSASSSPTRYNSSTSVPLSVATQNCACAVPIIAMAKGGKQNIRNEWNKRAVTAVGGSIAAQADWLKGEYDKATGADKQKIKTAQKAIDSRKNGGGGGN